MDRLGDQENIRAALGLKKAKTKKKPIRLGQARGGSPCLCTPEARTPKTKTSKHAQAEREVKEAAATTAINFFFLGRGQLRGRGLVIGHLTEWEIVISCGMF